MLVKTDSYIVEKINTLIVEFKLADICLAKLKKLPWSQCRVLGSRGIYANHFPTNELAQQKVGVWYPADDASSPDEDSSSADSAAQPPLPPPPEAPSPAPSPCTAEATPTSPDETQPVPSEREGNPDSSSPTDSS